MNKGFLIMFKHYLLNYLSFFVGCIFIGLSLYSKYPIFLTILMVICALMQVPFMIKGFIDWRKEISNKYMEKIK